MVKKRYKDWCEENGEQEKFETIVFCHSLYEKSNEMYELLNNHQTYHMADDYKEHTSSAMSLDEFKDSKSTLRKNTQPFAIRTGGSTFKNPNNKQSAWRLIDSIGYRGKKLGGAKVVG